MRLAAAILLSVVAAGCGGSGEGAPIVFAAASLGEVLPKIDPDARYSFGGSDQLAAQIRSGAPADVFASATPTYPDELHAEGLVDAPRAFATNRLVGIVRDGFEGGLDALTRPGVKVVLAAQGVPAGDYARAALRSLGLDAVLANVVSEEDDVKGVVSKVALGEADAGIVYSTDVAPVGGKVRVIPVPASAQPRIEYSAAVVRTGSAAEAFMTLLLSASGRAALRRAGFGTP